MDHRVSDPFGGQKKQRQNRYNDLKSFGVQFSLRQGLLAPLGCGLAAQVAHFANHIKVDDRSQECQRHHGDTNGVLMEPVSRCVDSGRCRQGAEANGHAHAADGNDGSAGTLQDGEGDAGPVEERELEAELGSRCGVKRCKPEGTGQPKNRWRCPTRSLSRSN